MKIAFVFKRGSYFGGAKFPPFLDDLGPKGIPKRRFSLPTQKKKTELEFSSF